MAIRNLTVFLGLSVLCLTGCAGSGSPSSSAPTSVGSPGPIVFMGDSITARWGESEYAAPTLGQLVPTGVNEAISGQNTNQMLARFPQDVLALDPSVVVIEGGTNDLAEVTNYGRSPPGAPATINAISTMAEEASQAGARVFIASVIEVSMPQYGVSASDISSFNLQLQMLCADYGYTYIDYQHALELGGAQNPADFLSDGVHPSEEGYIAMWHVLRPQLSSLQ